MEERDKRERDRGTGTPTHLRRPVHRSGSASSRCRLVCLSRVARRRRRADRFSSFSTSIPSSPFGYRAKDKCLQGESWRKEKLFGEGLLCWPVGTRHITHANAKPPIIKLELHTYSTYCWRATLSQWIIFGLRV